jgi:hypothetical protein
MTITFQVGGGGHLDIDFWLNDPAGTHLWNVVKRDTGTFTFTATQGGKHEYCFSNAMSTVSSKTVSFNVYGVMWVVDDGRPLSSRLLTVSLLDIQTSVDWLHFFFSPLVSSYGSHRTRNQTPG